MNDHDGREAPQLPQYASPDQQERRMRDLGDARRTYTWTTQVATLPGVPLASKVPFEDEPSIPWLLTTLETAIPIAENTLEVKIAHGAPHATEDLARLEALRGSVHELRALHDGQSPGGLRGLFEAAPTFPVRAVPAEHAEDAVDRAPRESEASARKHELHRWFVLRPTRHAHVEEISRGAKARACRPLRRAPAPATDRRRPTSGPPSG
jgi:hypothetical protein